MSPSDQGLIRELRLIIRHRVPIIINVVVVTIAAVVYSLLATEVYEAHTSILPAGDSGASFGGLAGLLRDLPIQGANLPGVTTTTDLLAAMLHSRRLQEPVIDEFDLASRYKAKTTDHALLTFDSRLRAAVSDEGILHVRFRDRDPSLAADVLNRLVDELNHFNVDERTSRSRQTREFIEARMAETSEDLREAEERLKTYQEEHSVALAPEDMSAAESIGSLIARRLAVRVELDAMRQYMDGSSPQIVQRATELEALDREITAMPEIGLQAVRFYRDLKVQEQLFLYLNAQLEQTRIDESRDLPVIQVLDRATPPAVRSWPRRKVIVLSALIASAAIGLLLAHLIDFLQREKTTLGKLTSPHP